MAKHSLGPTKPILPLKLFTMKSSPYHGWSNTKSSRKRKNHGNCANELRARRQIADQRQQKPKQQSASQNNQPAKKLSWQRANEVRGSSLTSFFLFAFDVKLARKISRR